MACKLGAQAAAALLQMSAANFVLLWNAWFELQGDRELLPLEDRQQMVQEPNTGLVWLGMQDRSMGCWSHHRRGANWCLRVLVVMRLLTKLIRDIGSEALEEKDQEEIESSGLLTTVCEWICAIEALGGCKGAELEGGKGREVIGALTLGT
ncbi:hypothetical protein BT96DRAFT_944789 [Gymnopus androsaceus JB14]|uniref:Uncharacterized protein n=1 Tax=Gymnopus androsaceus JB14 TaxID=1447944 RepID=A0A6A4H3K0_9AGAR|nr:hypothetical protein BT96DRAFT_944789 [Gymnopus androsaceus JB14]